MNSLLEITALYWLTNPILQCIQWCVVCTNSYALFLGLEKGTHSLIETEFYAVYSRAIIGCLYAIKFVKNV